MIKKMTSYFLSLPLWRKKNRSVRQTVPDEPFLNFRASRSGDRRILCNSRTSCNGFWSVKVVKGLVGFCWYHFKQSDLCNFFSFLLYFPTSPFTILEPQDQEIGEFYVIQERRATDFEASKLWKGSPSFAEITISNLIFVTSFHSSFISRQALSQFWSFKIRSTTFPNCIKICWSTEFEAQKLGKGSLGSWRKNPCFQGNKPWDLIIGAIRYYGSDQTFHKFLASKSKVDVRKVVKCSVGLLFSGLKVGDYCLERARPNISEFQNLRNLIRTS